MKKVFIAQTYQGKTVYSNISHIDLCDNNSDLMIGSFREITLSKKQIEKLSVIDGDGVSCYELRNNCVFKIS